MEKKIPNVLKTLETSLYVGENMKIFFDVVNNNLSFEDQVRRSRLNNIKKRPSTANDLLRAGSI